MPLLPVDGPAEYVGSEVRFAMMDPAGGSEGRRWVVVTLGALEGLAPSDLTGRETAEWVDARRSNFELIASAKHDRGLSPRITANDWIERFPMPK